jgi:hypothetical protein
MNLILTVNDKIQASLFHDQPLGFMPAWVEFARDARGVRIIGEDGSEYLAGVMISKEILPYLDDVNDIILVHMRNGKPQEGYQVTFVNQYYDCYRRKGARNVGGWYESDTA